MFRSFGINVVRASAFVLTASSAFAGTIRVDDDGGPNADFTDIPPAIAAASPGDVILVEAGSYSAFTLSKGVSIVGAATAEIDGGIEVSALPPGTKAVISSLKARYLKAQSCAAPLMLTNLTLTAFGSQLPAGVTSLVEVADCTDVRMSGCDVNPVGASGTEGVVVHGSACRMEITRSTLRGEAGKDGAFFDPAGGGGAGLWCYGGADVHVSLTSMLGGTGGNIFGTGFGCCYAGNGGPGILVWSPARLLLTGIASNLVRGGDNGLGDDCEYDGHAAHGIVVQAGATARGSGVTIQGGVEFCGFVYAPVSGTLSTPAPPDPVLDVSRSITSGGPATFTLYGAPGARAHLWLGLKPAVVDIATTYEDKLVAPLRNYDLGTIRPSGSIEITLDSLPPKAFMRFQYGQPVDLPPGLLIVAQGRTIGGGGAAFTQSLPIVLR